jgi:NAD(P)-dependent dehydrogenase (short-subunit alcohol dehydrogenase family)
VTELLRPGVLAGVRVVVAGGGALGAAVAARSQALGAAVESLPVDPHGEEPEGAPSADVLVWDGDARFAGAAGVEAVRAALDGAWLAIRAVAVPQWVESPPGGRILLLAPRPGDAHAEAARAGLENLARTLSIEWARFGIRSVAVLPGARTPAGEVAELAAYLASPAGEYYAGCAFTLGATDG